MSHNLDDPEFWLPPLFFSVTDFNKNDFLVSESESGFSSPVDSSTETESDEDEFLTELTRRLSNSTHLSHDIWKPKPNHGVLPNEKADTMPTPPQSTLYKEELAKTTKLEQETSSGYLHFGAPPQKVSIVGSNSNKNAYNSKQRIFCQPLEQNRKGNGRALDLSPSAWPALQQSQYHKQPLLPVPWTSAAAVLIPKRQCTGTGVFLPRPVATQTPHPVALKQRNVSTSRSQQRRVKSRSPATMNNIEIRLPQEWTY